MPTVYQSHELVFKMHYHEANERHHTPHVHVEYGSDEVSLALDGTVLSGSLPRKQVKWLALG
jgi:hypothetical protein